MPLQELKGLGTRAPTSPIIGRHPQIRPHSMGWPDKPREAKNCCDADTHARSSRMLTRDLFAVVKVSLIEPSVHCNDAYIKVIAEASRGESGGDVVAYIGNDQQHKRIGRQCACLKIPRRRVPTCI